MDFKVFGCVCLIWASGGAQAINFGNILAIGDSMTGGTGSSAPNSYRGPLDQLLHSNGHTYQWQGPNKWGIFPTGQNNHHAGMGGWDADNLINGVPSQPSAGNLSNWLSTSNPDTVLFMTNINGFWRWGTNYLGNPTVQAEAMAWNNVRLRQILDLIYTHNANANIFFASPSHIVSVDAGSTAYNLYADDLHNLVQQIANEYALNGMRMNFVSLTPQTSTLAGVHAIPDGVHWNSAGATVGANAFYSAMTAEAVPEPATISVLAAASLVALRRKKSSSSKPN